MVFVCVKVVSRFCNQSSAKYPYQIFNFSGSFLPLVASFPLLQSKMDILLKWVKKCHLLATVCMLRGSPVLAASYLMCLAAVGWVAPKKARTSKATTVFLSLCIQMTFSQNMPSAEFFTSVPYDKTRWRKTGCKFQLQSWSCNLATLHWALSLLSFGVYMYINCIVSMIHAFMKYWWHQWEKDEQAIMRDEKQKSCL